MADVPYLPYVEMSLIDFLDQYPDYKDFLVNLDFDLTDPAYIVRISISGIEIGYRSDPEWVIK